jgi:hypothetical protein
MPELKSSNLAAAEYDPEAKLMVVTFRSGSVYTYANVPDTVYEGLLTATSPGSYLAENIKGKYSFTRG